MDREILRDILRDCRLKLDAIRAIVSAPMYSSETIKALPAKAVPDFLSQLEYDLFRIKNYLKDMQADLAELRRNHD